MSLPVPTLTQAMGADLNAVFAADIQATVTYLGASYTALINDITYTEDYQIGGPRPSTVLQIHIQTSALSTITTATNNGGFILYNGVAYIIAYFVTSADGNELIITATFS